MKLKDVKSRFCTELRMAPVKDALPDGSVGSLGFLNKVSAEDLYIFRVKSRDVLLHPLEKSAADFIDCLLKRGASCLAELLEVARDGNMRLRVVFFKGAVLEMGELPLFTPPGKISFSPKEMEKFVMRVPADDKKGMACYCAVCDAALMYDADSRSQQSVDFAEEETASEESGKQFVFLGKDARLYTKMQEDGMHVVRCAPAPKQEVFPYLCKCELKVCDKPTNPSSLAKLALERLGTDLDAYLKIWDKYGAIEGESLLQRARAIGVLPIVKTEPTDRGCRLFLEDIPMELSAHDSLEIVTASPVFINEPDMKFQDYQDFLLKEERNKHRPVSSCQIKRINRGTTVNSIDTDWKGGIPSGACAVLSTMGDEIQILRRYKARLSVLQGQSSNPLLADIVEGISNASRATSYTQVPALSDFVSRKIFKNPPTPRQKQAIALALNTPDIVLIQGPPGTGKTTVITAIIERLNEMADKSVSQRGQVLVSGVQHDAVDNILERLSVNTLPALKFGSRNSEVFNPLAREEERITHMVEEIAAETRKRNPSLSETEKVTRLQQMADSYASNPSRTHTEEFLEAVATEPLMPTSERTRARRLLEGMFREKHPQAKGGEIVRRIRAIRCTESSFADDGALRAQLLLDTFELPESLPREERELLTKAANWLGGTPPFLAQLRALRSVLLDRHLPHAEFRIQKVNTEVLEIVNAVRRVLQKAVSPAEARNAVIAQFLYALENAPEAIRDALKEYNFVYGATTQQSEGGEIRRAKKAGDMQDYDTVVIDEAARCGPRDLLIPMTKARRRIILVGDHRQLPQIVNDEIIRQMEQASATDDTATANASTEEKVDELLKISMFKYMFSQLKKMEKTDGIQRTITLDAQYRMHPLLGNFVSRKFYEDYGEGFRSPLPAELFDHSLPGIEHKAAIWLDVPEQYGPEARTETGSRIREAEAKAIARLINGFLSSEQGTALSFGVISFYRAQADLVERELNAYPAITSARRERVRIGTVDSFQGMEFDVTILSAVRCGAGKTRSRQGENDKGKKKAIHIFGHLMSENRLCVGVSRQKRCLIVVGDAGLYETPLAKEYVSAMHDYLLMCRQEQQGAYLPYERH